MLFYSKKGFSTAEVLVTIMIFSFGILPLIVLFQNSHKQTAQAKNLMIAQSLGRTIIAEIRSLGFVNVAKNISYLKDKYNKAPSGRLVSSDENSIVYPEYYERFKTEIEIEPNNFSAEDVDDPNFEINKLKIFLTVKWKESTREFDLGFGTLVVKYGT